MCVNDNPEQMLFLSSATVVLVIVMTIDHDNH